MGQGSYEEIDIIEKGGNYGWNGREGNECFNELCGKLGKIDNLYEGFADPIYPVPDVLLQKLNET